MYINSYYGGTVTSDVVVMETMIANLEHLLFKYRVNIGFYGHNHAVQRMSAVYDSKVEQAARVGTDESGNSVAYHEDPQATVHMVIGTGGAKFTVNYYTPYPEWCEEVFYRYGYAKVSAVNATYLNWEWIDASDNLIYDRMVITQSTDFTESWVLSSDSSSSSKDDSLDTVVLAFVIIGCVLFIVLVGLFAYRIIRSDTPFIGDGSIEKFGVNLSVLHDDGSEDRA
jgi:hypothetical protein